MQRALLELELRSIKPAACCRRGLQTCVRVREAPPSPPPRTSSFFPPPESQAVSGCAGPKRCHARVPNARARSCRVPRSRRPKQASLGRPETSSRCEITISHCISPPSGFNPTIRAAPEPRADSHALTTLGRAAHAHDDQRKSAPASSTSLRHRFAARRSPAGNADCCGARTATTDVLRARSTWRATASATWGLPRPFSLLPPRGEGLFFRVIF